MNLDVRHQAAREVIAGILRFAAKHPEWDLQMRGNHPSNDGFTLDPKWTPDGLLEKNFSEVVGHSICREIQDVRLNKVKDLLTKTDLPIDAIAGRCAFGNGNYLKNLFLKRFGQTMSAYRSANR